MSERASDFRSILRTSYDSQAADYRIRTRMQGGNQRNLLRLLQDAMATTAPLSQGAGLSAGQNWLDVGCGTGGLAEFLSTSENSLGRPSYRGVDLSPGMIKVCKEQADKWGLSGQDFQQADAENLPFPAQSFDVIFSNSVLHWLHRREVGQTPLAALREAERLLRPGGWLAVSMAAEGTARRFQAVFHNLAKRWKDQQGYAASLYRADPLGCVRLYEAVQWLQEAGFQVLSARAVYEPVLYEDAKGYADDVKAYGLGAYLSAWPLESWEELWQELGEAFVQEMGGGAYVHDQYMIYGVAKKE